MTRFKVFTKSAARHMALALFLGSFAPAVFAQTIDNTGSASYTDPDGTPVTVGSNTVGLVVTPNLTASKSFAPSPIVAGGVSTLTITLANPGSGALSGVAFTDIFPTTPGAMVVAATPNVTNTCGGTLGDSAGGALAAGDAGIRLVGATLPAGGGCTIGVDVTAPVDGVYTNTIPAGGIASVEGSSNTADVSGTLTVGQNLSASKSFSPNPIGVNGVSTLSITLTNPNATPLTSVAFTDTYPAQIRNSATPGGANTCGGAVTAAAGGGSVALVGGSIPAGGSCTVTVQVTSASAGNHINLIPSGAITTAEGATNPADASATLGVQAATSPAVVTFYQYAPGASTTSFPADGGGYNGDLNDQPGGSNDQNGASFTALPQPTDLFGNPIDPAQPLPVRETDVYHAGEPVVFTLTDANRNTDPAVREFVNVTLTDPVTGDVEIVRMQETGPDTGVFAAVIQSVGPGTPVSSGDGRISVTPDTNLRVDYTDPTDPLDVVQDMALVDPLGCVFDIATGLPLPVGITITIIDVNTGQPAIVYGDDGISSYPSTVTTGGTVTDSSGTVYQLPQGCYRFPYVQPGNYQLVVTLPPGTGYTVPSTSSGPFPNDPNGNPYSVGCIAGTPGFPDCVTHGSYGETFIILPGPALNIDIPADPPADPLQDLLLQKTVSQREASAGDFLQYTLSLQNRGAAIATAVTITDTLPAGFRYQPGSLRVAGVAVADPTISADGQTLTIVVGPLAAAPAAVQIQYVVQIVTSAARREAINSATADDDGVAGGRHSNTAQAAVRIRKPLFSDAYTIIGRVSESCEAAPEPVCPAPTYTEVPPQTYTVRARFDSGQATLKPEGEADLKRLVAQLRGKDIERIELIGHTDNQRLSAKTAARFMDNYGLSKARAATVGDYLARALGLAPNQVSADGKGPDEPVAGNDTGAGMAQNRRTEVRVYERARRVQTAACGVPAASTRAPSRKYTVRAQFDSARDTLKPEGVAELDKLVAQLRGKDIERIELIGHTDSQRLGRRAAAQFTDNHGLSRARARTVGDYLARSLGLAPTQVVADGKGPDEPVAGNDTPAGMAKNRRTEVLIFERGELVTATPVTAPAFVKAEDHNGRGVPNVRVLLDDGTYVATDRDGMFHFEGVRPGTRVVQLDLDSLAPGLQVVPRIQNSRFAGRSYSQFVDVQGGGLWRTDFHVCPGGADVGLTLSTKRGLPARADDAVRQFTVRANFDSGRDTLKAQGAADLDALAAKLRGLDIERIELVGHTDNQPLGVKTAARFGDNYGLSQARARAVGTYLAQKLGLSESQVLASGRGPDQPVAPNTTAASMAKNRRTEVIVHQREKGGEVLDPNALRHRVDVDGGGVPVKNLRVTAMLPEGASYVPGSARLDGAALPDPQVDGNVATFRLGDVGANWRHAIEFDSRLPAAPAAPRGTAQYTLRAQFDSGKATLKPEGAAEVDALIDKLRGADIERIELIGHTDNQRVGNPETLRLFKDNYGLSEARAQVIGDRLAAALGLRENQVSAVGSGPDTPVAPNDSAANMAKNRRTEVIVHARTAGGPAATACVAAGSARALATFDAEQGSNLRTPTADNAIPCFEPAPGVTHVRSERGAVAVKGTLVRETPAEIEAKSRKRKAIKTDVEAAGGDRDWLAGATPGVEWLYPDERQSPRAPATRIVVKHRPGQTVTLKVGGEAVHPLTYDGTKTSADNAVAVSVWRGVPLSDGDNRFEATITERGAVVQRLERVVHYANSAVRAELVPDESVLVADGIHPPVIAVRMLDREGRPVRAGVTGGYTVNAPFMPRQTLEQMQQRQLAGLDRFEPTWRVEGDDGIAYIELQPTTESGEVVLGFTSQDPVTQRASRRQEIRSWIEAAPRDWLVVGFAEGTVGYNTLKDNVSALPAGTEDEVYTDGQASLYAKGRVLGKWLLTMAYDSGKPDELERRRSLLSTIDPNEYYTLYGDGAEQRYDAPSQAKLYLKLERGQFYGLFGDYNTGLTVTQLSRYSRTLNGVKSELGGGPIVYNAFASETAQNFARDEIRGNGTSGLYRLSRREIVLNSEKVRIEARDRYRSEQVAATRYLARHLDYDIDYANGTLFFREPIQSRDADFNPVFIVAEYETFGAGEKELSAGGRLGVNLLGGRLSAGVSGVREEQVLGKSDLTGADVKVRVGEATELRLEGATSDGELGTLAREGDAWLAEVDHRGEKLDALLYSRRQEPGFGLNQQNASEAGTEKVGADLGYHFTPNFAVQGQAYQQENLASEATREVGSAKLQYRDDRNMLSAGYQIATDETVGGQQFESQQATFGLGRNFFNKALELSAAGDVGLGSKNENLDFPSRFQLGASYAVTSTTRLLAAQEYTDGEAFDTSTTRVGLQATPWKGARLNTTLNQSAIGEYGPRNFAQMGLTQALLLNERWGADLSVDSSRTFKESGQPAFIVNPNQPAAVTGGTLTDDFIAVSAGLTYRSELWSWNVRAESRDGSSSERYGFTTHWLRQATAGIAVSASLQAFQTELASGSEGRFGSASLSGAWRPLGSRWSVLDRLEFKYDELDQGTGTAPDGGELFGNTTLNLAGDAVTRRLINNFNLNHVSHEWSEQDRKGNLFKLEQRNQWSLYYGAKYAFDNFNGVGYSGYTDLIGIEQRYDLTRHWDIGFQASSLNSWSNHTHEYSAGPQLGWSPVTNGWLSLGYNLIGFYDRDFEAARYTAEGPYLKLRFKFDQNTRIPGRDRKDPRALEWAETATPAVDGGQGVAEPPARPVQAAIASEPPPVAAPEPVPTAIPVATVAPVVAEADGAPDAASVAATAAAVVAASGPAAPVIAPAAPAVAAPQPVVRDAAAPVGRYVVSVQSLPTAAEAEALAARVRAAGYPAAVVQPAEVYGVRWYRVNIPAFDWVRDARPVAESLKSLLPGSDPWVLPVAEAVATVAPPTTSAAPQATIRLASAGAPSVAASRGRYALMVASLPDAAQAEAYAGRLRAAGYGAAEVQPATVRGTQWHRVVIPGFGWVREAKGFGDALRIQFPDSDPWVMPLPPELSAAAVQVQP